MPVPTPIVTGLDAPAALRVTLALRRAAVLSRTGALVGVDIDTGAVTALADAGGAARGLDLDDAGSAAYVAGTALGLHRLALDGTGTDEPLTGALVNPRAVRFDDVRSRVLVAEGGPTGRLLSVSTVLPPGADVLAGPKRMRGVVVETATGDLVVAENVAGGRLVTLDAAGVLTELLSGLGGLVDLAWSDAAQRRLLVADAVGERVLEVDLDNLAAGPTVLFSGLADLWAAQPLEARRFVLGAGDALLLGDLTPAAIEPVELHVPGEPLFVAGWVKVPVVINDPAVTFADLEFVVEPRESAAMVSYSRDSGFDPARPDIMVTAGWLAGKHTLVAAHRVSGAVLAAASFEVVDTWVDPDSGPSVSVIGAVEGGPTAGTWGGGDFTLPQNLSVVPALGTRNIAVILVDTAESRYPAGAALTGIMDTLRAEVANGVMVGGVNRSVASYYAEASDGLFGLNLVGVVGPVSLPGNWGTYFTGAGQDSDNDGVNDWTQWSPVPTFSASVLTQVIFANEAARSAGAPPLLDLHSVDSIVLVVRSVAATPAAQSKFAWPRANLGPVVQMIGFTDTGFFRVPEFRAIASVFMPDDWSTQPRSGRRFHETLAHELGHNLQLNDQYFQKGVHDPAYRTRIADANPGESWELMSWEEDLPALSAGHRLMLGWVPSGQVKLFNFAVFGAVDETFTLHAVGAGAPPAGRFAAAEIRITDGKNYYFEYRPAVAGRDVDPAPPAALTVFGAEVTSRGSTPANKPEILRLINDTEPDRGEFQAGDDFKQRDSSSPGFPNDLVVDVVSTTADSAVVRVRYGLSQKPDPALIPWSAHTNWQSPDIEVVNARSLADPAFRNVPWEGHDNTVVARVKNRGQLPAPAVDVAFFAKDFTFGGGAEVPLGSATHDVGTGAVVPFSPTSSWRPPQLQFPFGSIRYEQHSCIVARIAPYVRGALVEVTPDNNEAQSNYSWMATTTASPASREATVVMAENPLPVPAVVSFEASQPHPLFRTYLSNRWLRLEPGERKPVLVMVESLFGDKRYADIVGKEQHGEDRIAVQMRLTALADTGEACAPTVIGGATIVAIAGRATQFREFVTDGRHASGVITTVDNGDAVSGPVLVSVRGRNDDRPEKTYATEAVGGEFRLDLGGEEDGVDTVIQGHYLGALSWGPCESSVTTL